MSILAQRWQKQKDIMDLTAALLSAIPWGNFGLSAKAAVDKAEQEAKDLQEVVQSGEHAKSYRRIAWLQERLWSAEGQDPTKFTTKHIALNAVGAGFWNLAKDAAFDWNYWNPAVSIGMRNEKLAKFHTVVPTAPEKSLENISRELRDKTIPKLQAPSTFSTMGPNLREMRNTAWQELRVFLIMGSIRFTYEPALKRTACPCSLASRKWGPRSGIRLAFLAAFRRLIFFCFCFEFLTCRGDVRLVLRSRFRAPGHLGSAGKPEELPRRPDGKHPSAPGLPHKVHPLGHQPRGRQPRGAV